MARVSGSSWFTLPGPTRLYTEFRQEPVCAKRLVGGAPTGTAGDRNLCSVPGYSLTGPTAFEYTVIGTQTVVAPSLTANGMDIAMTATSGQGAEWNNGVTARNPLATIVGTDGACYVKATFKVEDASGCNPLVVGFRKAAAFAAAFTTGYTDYAVIGIVGTAAKIQTVTNLANAGAVTTDTTQTWADAATHTLAVYVDANGVVTYKLDNAAPTVVAAYTFTAATVIIPFVVFTQASDVTANVEWSLYDAGS